MTGTATEQIRLDVVSVLKMRNTKFFLASFNRTNLFYEVRPKTPKIMEDIIDYIKTFQNDKTGLIYCISKKDCEKVSKNLKKEGVKSGFYHAGINDEKRTSIQNK